MLTKFCRGHRSLLVAGFIALLGFSTFADSSHPVSVADSALETSQGGNGDSGAPIISPGGRYVFFASTASNLLLTTNDEPMAAAFPARINVFLRDRTNANTVLISASLSGETGGNGDSIPTGFSTNGQFALFESDASDLVANDTNSATDIFVRDLVSGVNILVSASTTDGFANGVSRGSVLSPDGRYVAFVSAASNLVADDTNGIADVFVRDLHSETTILASSGAIASNSLSVSESPDISDDGRYVVFYSTATNLVEGVGTTGEVYVRDLVGGMTTLVSTNTRAALSDNNVVSYNHVLSADGKFVAYAASRTINLFSASIFRYSLETGLTELVHTNAMMPYGPRENIRTLDITPDGRFIAFTAVTNSVPSICVWDAQTGISTVASRDITNGIAIGSFASPVLDSTGRFVSFVSTATNLTTNLIVSGYQIYVRDLLLDQTSLVNMDANSAALDVPSFAFPSFSANGKFVVFENFEPQSAAENPRRNFHVYVRDLQTNTLELISVRHPALQSVSPDATSDLSSLSANGNGRFIAFASLASNLAADDNNANRDIFVRDLLNETNVLVSVGTDGFSAAGMSFEPAISSDGGFVAFTSMATNLTSGDTNKMRDVFVADLQTQAMVLGSVATNGAVGNAASYSPVISDGGRFLFFRSLASNLAPGSYAAAKENLFWRDLETSTTIALTTGGLGSAGITPDGRYAAYRPTNSASLYIWDSFAGTRVYTNSFFNFTLVGISPNGKRLAYTSSMLQVFDWMTNTNRSIGGLPLVVRAGIKFSADGEFLIYASTTAQAGNDVNSTYDVYLYDFQSATKTLVSHAFNNSGIAASGASDYPDISYDGRFVAYRSVATNIVANDINGWPDVFVYDRMTGTNTLLSANAFGHAGDNRSFAPVFSRDGRTLVFSSWASDLVANDFNHVGDLISFSFLYATVTKANQGEGLIISWPSAPGGNYQVQFKNNVDDPIWQELNGTITIKGNTSFIQDASPATDQMIYRVISF